MKNEKTTPKGKDAKGKAKRTPHASCELREGKGQSQDAASKGQHEALPVKHPGGRPTDYTPELAAIICHRLMRPETMRQICRDPDMPSRSMVHRWLLQYEEFRDQYAQARDIQSDEHADMILEVAFETQGDVLCDEFGNTKPNHEYINRSKLKIDALKWHASKASPKKYGDKVEQTIVGDPERPQQHNHTVDIKSMTPEQLKDFIRNETHGGK